MVLECSSIPVYKKAVLGRMPSNGVWPEMGISFP